MTTYTSLRTAIATVLEGITDIGLVHNRERFVVDPAAYLDMFKTTVGGTVQIRAWLILRERVDTVTDTAFGEDRDRHLFVLAGFLGFQDSADTYGALQALCDSVRAAFSNQTTLGVSGVMVRAVGPCTLRTFDVGQFGSVLCHRAEIELPIETMQTIGTA